ncbi:MAG TPA: protein kinase [Thermoanaerobaculia bacterium]|nr:protein kinase [Thermoanaerobaculia bacterium]
MEQTLAPGLVLSRYRIIERIGAGGMGEVYKAHDPSLERFVALKILPPELVSHQDRLQRFVQEAKTASSLSHPNIVTIHEIGQAKIEGSADSSILHFISMELVEGETLRKKIHRERRSLRSLLDYLAQAADGLAKAHAAGVVHRDLKPDNIMVTEDGFAKILDFGLAKLVERADLSRGADDPTALREKTREGMILGTVGYMSPEQVEGRQADSRSDVFSFGCILYEAVTRKKPFAGESEVDVLHRIVHEEPESLADLAADAPWELRRIVKRCLAKEPEKRYQSMRDLANELRDLVDDFDQLSPGSGSRAPSGVAASEGGSSRRPLIWGVIAGTAIAAAVVAGFMLTRPGDAPPPRSRMTIQPLTTNGNVAGGLISPDGRYLAYFMQSRGNRAIYLRQIATGSEVPVLQASSTLRVIGAEFSQDGNYLYVTRGEVGQSVNSLIRIPTLGGAARNLIDDVDSGVSLSPDETEGAFIRHVPQKLESHLVIAKLDGSGERVLTVRKGTDFFADGCQPAWSPDGLWIATCAGSSAEGMRTTIMLYSPDGTRTRDLIERPWFQTIDVEWIPDGSGLVVAGMEAEAQNDQIWLFPFPSGEPHRITNDLTGYGDVSLSADGTALVAVAGEQWYSYWRIDPTGPTLLTNEGDRSLPRGFSLLPDESFLYHGMASGNLDIWRLMPGGEKRQLTSHPRADYEPVPSPDGSVIYFQTERNGASELWRMNPEGGEQERLGRIGSDVSLRVTPDGRRIAFELQGKISAIPASGGELETLFEIQGAFFDFSPDGTMVGGLFRLAPLPAPYQLAVFPAVGGEPKALADNPGIGFRTPVQWTPDGTGLAYVRDEAGASNVWVQPIDGGAPRQLTRFESGSITDFTWDREGKKLFLVRGTLRADMVRISGFR